MLIEVLVSAMLVAAIAVGTYTGLAAANHASTHERFNAQATVIAQQDEDRLRGLSVAELDNLLSGGVTYTVAENGMCVEEVSHGWEYFSKASTTSCEAVTGFKGAAYTGTIYTVTSSAKSVTAAKESFTCETTTGAAANYLQTTSSVNWSSVGKHSPVSESSLVAASTAGTLRVKVKNSKAEPVPGATVTVTDKPSTGSTVTAVQTTPASGCVTFSDLPEGTAKVLASKAGWIESTGKAPLEKTTSITTKSLAEVEFTIEGSGGIQATFINNAGQTVQGSTFVAFQTEMGSPAFVVGGEVNKVATSDTLEGLYPFANDYRVYAGDCEANKPAAASGAKEESVLVEPGVAARPASVEVPAVNVTVYEGTETEVKNAKAKGEAPKVITSPESIDMVNIECSTAIAQNHTKAEYKHPVTLSSKGELANGEYQPYAKKLEFCVSTKLGTKEYYKSVTSFANEKKAGVTIGPIYLKSATKTTALTACP
jgi:type II secretory pathway pseudopilin PulG